jgi:hypothetical protein
MLEDHQKMRDQARSNGEKIPETFSDKMLDVFLPVKVGIAKNGYTSEDISEIVGAYNFEEKAYVRTALCNFVTGLVSDGFPFGSIKIKGERLKKYGWPSDREILEITSSRKERLLSETKACKKYLQDSDPLLTFCNKVIEECDKQLKLFYNE